MIASSPRFQAKWHVLLHGRLERRCRCLPDKQAVTPGDPLLSAPANWLVIDQLKDSLIYGKEDLCRQPPGMKQSVMNARSRSQGMKEAAFSEDIQEFVMHRWADTLHHGSGCFLPNTMDPNNTSKLCASVVAGVCSGGAEREHGKGSWRKGQQSDRARQKNKAASLIHLWESSE